MPVVVTAELVLVVCGVMVSVVPETQYEYGVPFRPSEIVTVLPEVEYELPVNALVSTAPIPPVWSTVAGHEHPPPLAASAQLAEA